MTTKSYFLGGRTLRLPFGCDLLVAHPEGKSFYTASPDFLCLWSAETGEPLLFFDLCFGTLRAKPGDGLFDSADTLAWQFSSRKSGAPLALHPVPDSAFLWWVDSARVLSLDLSLQHNGSRLGPHSKRRGSHQHASLSRDAQRVLLQQAQAITLWERGEQLCTIACEGAPPCAWLSPGGSRLLLSSSGELRAYEVQEARERILWSRPPQQLDSAAFFSDELVVTITARGVLQGLSMRDGALLWERELPAPTSQLVVDEKSGLCAVATIRGLWVLGQDGGVKHQHTIALSQATKLAFSPAFDWVAICEGRYGLRLFSLSTGAEEIATRGHTTPIASLCWLGQSLLTTAQGDPVLRRWSFGGPACEWSFELPHRKPKELLSMPSGDRFIARFANGEIGLFSADGDLLQEISVRGPGLYEGMTLSPDGAVLYLLSKAPKGAREVAAWSLQTAQLLFVHQYPESVRSISATKEGLWVFSSSAYWWIDSIHGYRSERKTLPARIALSSAVLLNEDEALGLFLWIGKAQELVYLRRWRLSTGALLWSREVDESSQLLAPSLASYVVSFNKKGYQLYSALDGALLAQGSPMLISGEICCGAASLHGEVLGFGLSSGEVWQSKLPELKIPTPGAREGWVRQFFLAVNADTRRELFQTYWEGLSPDWQEALRKAYAPLEEALARLGAVAEIEVQVLEGFLLDALRVSICGAPTQLDSTHEYNPSESYHPNDTLEPLRCLRNVVFLDCSYSMVTSLAPVQDREALELLSHGCRVTS